MTMAMEDQVCDIILNAYGMRENGRREALSQLQEFSNHPQSWGILFNLLEEKERKQVQFYASNMIYNKVQKDWHKTTDEEKQNIYQKSTDAIESYVKGYKKNGEPCSIEKNSMQRLSLVLARVVVQTPNVLTTYIDLVKNFLLLGIGETPIILPVVGSDNNLKQEKQRNMRYRALYTCTQLIIDIADENEAIKNDLTAGLDPEGIYAKMMQTIPIIMEIIMKLLKEQQDFKIYNRSLECLHRWVQFGIDMASLSSYGLLRPILNIKF